MYSWYINTGPTHNFRLSTRQHTHGKSKSGMSQQQRQFRRVQVGLIVIVHRGSTNSKNKYSSNNAMNVNPSSCSSPPARAVYSLQQKRWSYKRTLSLQPAQPSVNWVSSEEERQIHPKNKDLAKLALADVWDILTKQSQPQRMQLHLG